MIKGEPWFDDRLAPTGGNSATWRREDEISWNQLKRHSDKHYFYQTAYEFISDNKIVGDYHEFGCHRCRTFRMSMLEAARHLLDDMKFYAYDSFEGLPDSNPEHGFGERWKAGSLATSTEEFKDLIQSSDFSLENVILHKGFYDEILPKLALEKPVGRKAAFICIDCDLYEIAKPVFTYIEDIIQDGTILYIDDFFVGYNGSPRKGVSRALSEWLVSSSWNVIDYRGVGWAGKSFICYA